MATHRCAACGSPNVLTDTQSGGVSYNYKKGIVGTVVLGVGGAVAGIESKTQNVFKCQDCGITLTYEMPEKIKDAINRGLINETARNSLYVDGMGQLRWESLKRMYKNIEEGIADRIIADRENQRREDLLAYATATQEEFDEAVDLITDFERRFSYDGSIDDELPKDAFSDTKPMTLLEYYAWQDAIALFIENSAKYLPYPLTDYKGIREMKITYYFGTYLYEKIRIEYGHLPIIDKDKNDYCEDLKKYASENPFVLYFADKYFGQRFHHCDPDQFATIFHFERMLRKGPSMIWIQFKFNTTNNETISCLRRIPRYIVKDGRLGYWYESNPHNRLPDADAVMEDYFITYPEKRSEFNERISAYKKQLSETSTIENKVKSYEQEKSENENTITEKSILISKLQKKIFGKKTALAQAALLEDEIRQIQEKNNKLKNNINSLNRQIKQLKDEKTFYEKLVEDMDCFIAWRWIDSN